MNFPIYRRLKNGKSYYIILAADRMKEYQKLGKNWLVHEIHAKILPERLLISDIIENLDGQYENSSAAEFVEVIGPIANN
ncbi:MAG: hypothetical protein K1X54_01425 [Flavobacteriales bacterium]|nr:hypothetical protein [Flavobacteriales bacterium]